MMIKVGLDGINDIKINADQINTVKSGFINGARTHLSKNSRSKVMHFRVLSDVYQFDQRMIGEPLNKFKQPKGTYSVLSFDQIFEESELMVLEIKELMKSESFEAGDPAVKFVQDQSGVTYALFLEEGELYMLTNGKKEFYTALKTR